MEKSGLILSYGEIGSSDKTGMSELNFKKQIEYLHSIDAKCHVLGQISTFSDYENNVVFITVDGGNKSDIDIVAPTLNKYGIKATFFIPAEKYDSNDDIWNAYKDLIKDGHQIGSMGLKASNFAKLNVKQQMYQLKKSKYILEEKLGVEIQYFALPNGKFNHHTIRLASDAQYKMLLTTRFGFFSLSKVPFLTKRWRMTNAISLDLFKKVTQANKLTLKSMRYRYFFGKLWQQMRAPLSYS